jgi:hypothetical protein
MFEYQKLGALALLTLPHVVSPVSGDPPGYGKVRTNRGEYGGDIRSVALTVLMALTMCQHRSTVREQRRRRERRGKESCTA